MFLVALLLVLVIGDALAWHFAVQQLRAGLDAWIAERRASGWSVASEAPQAGGWPLAATLSLRNVAMQGGAADIPGGMAWRATGIVLRLDLRHPRVLQIDAEGQQSLRLGSGPDIPCSAGRLQMLVPLRADPTTQAFDLRGEAVRAKLPVGGAEDLLTIDRLDVDTVLTPAAQQGQAAVSTTMKANGIGLPTRLHWPLGSRIESVALEAALNGPLPAGSQLTARAAAWRDEGGSLEVQHVETHWGPLGLTATATLALDPELQPMGTGTAQVTGYAETLDALARDGLMSKSAAITAKAVLSLLANAPDDGSPAEVEVPLSLQYRTLSMRQVPLVRLPELDWPLP
jgi:hypothetical protein